MNNVKKWAEGETYAKNYLIKCGYEILATNYKNVLGEIDIIAKDTRARQLVALEHRLNSGKLTQEEYDRYKTACADTIVFVEVKARETDRFGTGLEAVNYTKQQKIIKTATIYLKTKKLMDANVRFDVISVVGDTLEHIKNAFC